MNKPENNKEAVTLINNKALLYSTGNYIQSLGINHNGKEYFKKNVYMYKTESLCHTADCHNTVNQLHCN